MRRSIFWVYGLLEHEVPLYRIRSHVHTPGQGTTRICTDTLDPVFRKGSGIWIGDFFVLDPSVRSSGAMTALFMLVKVAEDYPDDLPRTKLSLLLVMGFLC